MRRRSIALAFFATLPRGDAALPLRQQAGTVAERVFARNPKHPGAAHYILHAYDHGSLASKALPAARAYAKIAPQASHALHMPAHAFLQVGFWDEAAATDEASWNASIGWAKRRGLPITSRDYHSLHLAPVRVDAQGKIFQDEGSYRVCRSGVERPGTQDPGPKTTACGWTWVW